MCEIFEFIIDANKTVEAADEGDTNSSDSHNDGAFPATESSPVSNPTPSPAAILRRHKSSSGMLLTSMRVGGIRIDFEKLFFYNISSEWAGYLNKFLPWICFSKVVCFVQ